MVYENGVAKLQQQAKQDLLWFLCKVVPTVQKTFTPSGLMKKAKNTTSLFCPLMKHLLSFA